MRTVLQIGNQTIADEQIICLLTRYQMLPHLLREIIIDQVIAPIDLTPEEKAIAHHLLEQQQLNTETSYLAWCKRFNINIEQLETLATRQLRIEKFKQVTWGDKLDSYFLKRKGQLDKVIYSLIRTKDTDAAREIYFRIQESEKSFADLARSHSQGREAQTGGLNGPVELGTLPLPLMQMLSVSQPSQLWPPTSIERWVVIVRLEKFIPVQLDESIRQGLLNELFTTWLSEQMSQIDFAMKTQVNTTQLTTI
ncbi:peptidylprolyl isomerase [Nodularia sp. UHCC 0506]|uniref:peptidylprolyl isomerase n=1 Tax=Nodularia sp. UHCC 0506 TaxID=3110243 RepID=UPI002B1FFB77|nr:peptidylprolyl isomerase [Nodularia sp. UHCC 0506]MEA5517088.1 peptidylprolyl isomerase [Nodularia sp. UHCC 0506]